jgi:hypothetical protein
MQNAIAALLTEPSVAQATRTLGIRGGHQSGAILERNVNTIYSTAIEMLA